MSSASAQKWGGVQKKTIRKRNSAGTVRLPFAAAQPTSGGTAPADDHAARAREQEQGHDARLRQRGIVTPGAGRDALAAEGLRRGDERGSEGERGDRRVQRLAGNNGGRAEESERNERRGEEPW